MSILESFKLQLCFNRCIGLAPITKKGKTCLKYFLDLLPVLLSSTVGLCIATFIFVFPNFESFSSIHTLINFASHLTFVLVLLSATFQCFYYKSTYQNIINRIRQIEKRGKEKFWYKTPRSIKFYYYLKVVCIFCLYFVSQGLLFVEVVQASDSTNVGSKMWSPLLTSSLRLITPFAVIHIILFGDIVTTFILEINEQITNTITFSHLAMKIEILKNVKLMHMDLFILVKQINMFFGWNLLCLIINSFIYVTSQLYWIFLALELKWDTLPLMGMYFCSS